VVVKSPQFYKDCYFRLLQMKNLWDWFGDMAAIRDVLNTGKYKVKALPEEKYCRIPTKLGQGDDSAVLWHYAGNIRKEWMKYHGQLRRVSGSVEKDSKSSSQDHDGNDKEGRLGVFT
jgi:hypothetical protein